MQTPFVLHVNAWGYFLLSASETSMIINQPDMTENVTSLDVCCLDLIVFYAKQSQTNDLAQKYYAVAVVFFMSEFNRQAGTSIYIQIYFYINI